MGTRYRGSASLLILVQDLSYNQMSQKIQNIQKTGGKILSITEVA
ncbi:hypothetical protein SD80_030895 [Scytonema tolypothrichoides VB-61278]|nr:hypothetical protein SD80_030895 [Scytonema tolypothrichoides VB-61278]